MTDTNVVKVAPTRLSPITRTSSRLLTCSALVEDKSDWRTLCTSVVRRCLAGRLLINPSQISNLEKLLYEFENHQFPGHPYQCMWLTNASYNIYLHASSGLIGA